MIFLTHGRTFVSQTSLQTAEVSLYPHSNQTEDVFSFVAMKPIILSRLDSWLLTLRCSQAFQNDTIQAYYLLKTRSTMNVFSSKKMRVRFLWFFRSFNKRVLLSRRLLTIASLNMNFLKRLNSMENVQSPLCFNLEQNGDWNFLPLWQSCHFLTWVALKGILGL